MDLSNFWKNLLFLGLLIQFSNGGLIGTNSLRNPNDFDLLVFTQHWPKTVCFEWREKSDKNKCTIPNDEEWTIHGIWPTQFHKIAPLFCNKTLHFDLAALASIEDILEVKWVDIEHGLKPASFWKHEWEKHGTCASVLECMSTEKKYFQKGIDLLDEYDMKNVLGKASIYPGNQYPVEQILDGIKKILDVNAQVMCVKHPKTHVSYIFEIRICFDKTLKLVDCDGIVGFPTDCSHSEDVIYPGTVPQEFSVVQIQ
ncbi:ribonuclease Oy-like [Belonocnema kinseyi]|uniref:ribonuclease Oy-like n=1 Tax=Belonocnema kinseyi TaxID=2817044 RepID=UPI00143D05E4|nr:ribonuclease Oy-like [Belonocnema kinseyi]